MRLILTRIRSDELGTFGELRKENGELLCVTCEDPWKGNQRNVSCIPGGIYHVKRHNGFKYKDVWALQDVPNRSAILIHNGNTIRDTEGCILVGSDFGQVDHLPAVINSQRTLARLRRELPAEFEIEIVSKEK